MVHPRDFSFQLMPLDTDLFTLDMPDFFKSAFVRSDLSLLSTVAKSIFGVETCFGRIPCRVAVGNRSAMVLDQLEAYEASQESAQERCFNTTRAAELFHHNLWI